jgi:porphobilinogen deaminase
MVERLFLAKLGEGCHTAFACHYANSQVYLFLADFGLRILPFGATDLSTASTLADKILAELLPRS